MEPLYLHNSTKTSPMLLLSCALSIIFTRMLCHCGSAGYSIVLKRFAFDFTIQNTDAIAMPKSIEVSTASQLYLLIKQPNFLSRLERW